MAALPFILAGPIVRRVEPEMIGVWIALSEPRHVKLEIWLGPTSAAQAGEPRYSGTPAETLRVGPKLHIALATVVPKTPLDRLLPEQLYSYQLSFATGADQPFSQSLLTEGLLQDVADVRLALGYETGRLPSFVLPPKELEDLKILHGSCRRPHVEIPDAMVFVDDVIAASRTDAKKRPHHLFLTGDQIYADDVASLLLPQILALGEKLFDVELVPTRWPHLDPERPVDFVRSDTLFPPRFRQLPVQKDAEFTTSDGANHLITLGDFAAHYLLVWNSELWEALPTVEEYRETVNAAHLSLSRQANVSEKTLSALRRVAEAVEPPKRKPTDEGPPEDAFKKGLEKQARELERFRRGLPKVRRALANVATYMMFDDHEITDDWFLSAAWRDRVLTSPLGRTIFRNGLLAYALFQGWGNDPAALTTPSSPHAKLRELVSKLVPPPDAKTFIPDAATAVAMERVLGLSGDGATVARWHYSVRGPRHQVFVLDCRMRRSYRSRLAGPGNVAKAALQEQIPAESLPEGVEVAIVVSSLTVLGPPVVDALLGPMLYRTFDLKTFLQQGEEHAGIAGLDPDAIEAWPNDDDAFENLLARVQPLRRVVFLSGDVHFATSAAMTYFKAGAAPTRIAQFTSSGLKNKFKQVVVNLEGSLAFSQRMATEGVAMERLGWTTTGSTRVKVPEGAVLRPPLRHRLDAAPVLVPTHGWPDGTQSTPSDWSWRMQIVEDTRPTATRPAAARPVPLFSGEPQRDVANDLDGLRRTAARHAAHLDRFAFGRRLLFYSNLGVVSFERRATAPDAPQWVAVHELRARGPEDTESLVYTRHEVVLDPAADEKPPRIGGEA